MTDVVRCECNSIMLRKFGVIERKIKGATVKIRNAPFYECISIRCQSKAFDLEDCISSLAIDAYKRGLPEIEYVYTDVR